MLQRRPGYWFQVVMGYLAVEAAVTALVVWRGDMASPRMDIVFRHAPQELWAWAFALLAVFLAIGVFRPAVGRVALIVLTSLWAGWVTGYLISFILVPASPLFLLVALCMVALHFLLILSPEASSWTLRP